MAVRRAGARERAGEQRRLLSAFLIAAAIVAAAVILKRHSSPLAAAAVPAPVVGAFDTVTYPVPLDFVPAGTKVRDIPVREMAFPKHQVPPGALRSLAGLEGAVAIAPLPANLPLFIENFSMTGGTNPVIEQIPPGMRAMTLKVDATTAVEGWATSGSTVDVLLVEKDRTTVVAERVRVLSAERSVSPLEGSAPNVPSTVTLLVGQEQCLAINTAIPRGRIAFALRSARDEEPWQSSIYTADRLHGLPAADNREVEIKGYIAISGQDAPQRAYALTGGKWIETDVVPEGVLVGRSKRE